VFEAARLSRISARGFAELVSHVGRSVIPLRVGFHDLCALPCWPTTKGLSTLAQAVANSAQLTDDFTKLIEASGLPLPSLQSCATRVDSILASSIPSPRVDPHKRSEEGLSPARTGLVARRSGDPFGVMEDPSLARHRSTIALP